MPPALPFLNSLQGAPKLLSLLPYILSCKNLYTESSLPLLLSILLPSQAEAHQVPQGYCLLSKHLRQPKCCQPGSELRLVFFQLRSCALGLGGRVAAGQLLGAVAGFHGLEIRGCRRHKARPEPVLAPDDHHLLDGDVFGLRQQERHKQSHHRHPGCKEEEDAVLRTAARAGVRTKQRRTSAVNAWTRRAG